MANRGYKWLTTVTVIVWSHAWSLMSIEWVGLGYLKRHHSEEELTRIFCWLFRGLISQGHFSGKPRKLTRISWYGELSLLRSNHANKGRFDNDVIRIWSWWTWIKIIAAYDLTNAMESPYISQDPEHAYSTKGALLPQSLQAAKAVLHKPASGTVAQVMTGG